MEITPTSINELCCKACTEYCIHRHTKYTNKREIEFLRRFSTDEIVVMGFKTINGEIMYTHNQSPQNQTNVVLPVEIKKITNKLAKNNISNDQYKNLNNRLSSICQIVQKLMNEVKINSQCIHTINNKVYQMENTWENTRKYIENPQNRNECTKIPQSQVPQSRVPQSQVPQSRVPQSQNTYVETPESPEFKIKRRRWARMDNSDDSDSE
jgi:hypothetical protein